MLASQIGLLLWKNYLNQRRQKLVTFLEIILPALFTGVLLIIRQQFESIDHPYGDIYMPFQPNIVPYWPTIIAYTPQNEETDRIMNRVQDIIFSCDLPTAMQNSTNCVETRFYLRAFENEDAMVKYLLESLESTSTGVTSRSPVLGGIVFPNHIPMNGTIKYKIRLSDTSRNILGQVASGSTYKPMENEIGWDTSLIYPLIQRIGPREGTDSFGGAPGYFYEGFLALQYGVDTALIEHLTGKPNVTENILVSMLRYAYPPYVDNQFVVVIETNLPVIVMLGYILAVLNITRNVVLEKEKRLKGFMKIMGLQNWTHWLSHFVWNFGFLFITNIIMCIILTVDFNNKGAVIQASDSSIVFLFLTVYSITAICFCFAVGSFFMRGNVAAAAAGMLWFGTYLPYFFIQAHYDTLKFSEKVGSCIVINTAMSLGGQLFGMFEGTGKGVQYATLGKAATVDDNFTLGHVMLMMLLDAAICMLVAWYVESVRPGDDGIALPWYFPFTKTYWKSFLPHRMQQSNFMPIEPGQRVTQRDETCFEADPDNLDAVVRIMGIGKTFGRGKRAKLAVENMSLNMYSGQVTALLGHNGAGKTTTMSMVTGLLPPSAGTAYVCGLDIRNNITDIQRQLGLCPQHNILFDNLTVYEHLLLFGKLKGGMDVEAESRRMIESLNMVDKSNALAKTLSGGMKRKLSVGIALIGNSKVVLLDEPTAGMDPSARRSTWDLIQRERAGRTIVLTTHYMEEADLLGDRIAIMAKGRVRCCGSSLFLKNRYGAGYRLIVVFQPGTSIELDPLCNVIRSRIPDAKLDTLAGLEAAFILPQQRVSSFQTMFQDLESHQNALNVASFGVSLTTMEEVFIRVGETFEQTHENAAVEIEEIALQETQSTATGSSYTRDSGIAILSPPRNDGLILNLQQFHAMLIKKMLHTLRNWKILIPQLIVPTIIVLLCLILNKYLPSRGESAPLEISIKTFESYGTVVADFMENRRTGSAPSELPAIARAYVNMLESDRHIQTQNITRLFRETEPWKFERSQEPCAFEDNLFGFDTYISQSAKIQGDAFNVHHILGAIFEEGNTIENYANELWRKVNETSAQAKTDECSIKSEAQKKQLLMVLEGYLCDFDHDCHRPYNYTVTATFNNAPYHAVALSLDKAMNGLLRYSASEQHLTGTSSIVTVNHPLPPTSKDEVASARSKQVQTWDLAFTFGLAMSFLSGSFLIFLVKERITKAKHLQTVCGVNPINFWLSALVWDWINFMVPQVLVFVLLFVFDVPAFTKYNRPWLTIILFSEYGFAALLFTYAFSFFFHQPTVGFVKMCIYNLLLGPGLLLIVGVLEIPQMGLMSVRNAIYWISLVISPHFCISQAMRDMGDNHLSASICKPLLSQGSFCVEQPSSACCGACQHALAMTSSTGSLCLPFTSESHFFRWRYPGAGRHFTFMLAQCAFYIGFILVKEFGLLTRLVYALRTKPNSYVDVPDAPFHGGTKDGFSEVPKATSGDLGYESRNGTTDYATQKTTTFTETTDLKGSATAVPLPLPQRDLDEDVRNEQALVANTQKDVLLKQGALVMSKLRKTYGGFTAVDGLSICIGQAECFGFLGVNGAGKTTTFSMLTGDQTITDGNAYINGFDIKTQLKKAQQCIGFCPQFDALIDQMTGYETLKMFGRLRGIPEKHLKDVVEQLVDLVDLKLYASKQCGTYSGGNRRKLSIAVSLVGNPSVVLLDEPTNGLDPVARRHVWLLLSRIRLAGTPIVLTSHIMEECEALCTRIAIMVAGQFECLGSPQHLKNKFGSGFVLTVKVESLKHVHRATRRIQSAFKLAAVKDVHQRLISFLVADNGLHWSTIFGRVEELKKSVHIVDYSVSQTTLEQIFLTFSTGVAKKDLLVKY